MSLIVKRVLCYFFAIVFCLLGWEITSLILNSVVLPSPIETLPVFLTYVKGMTHDFVISTWRVILSLFIGCVFGYPIGIALGRCPRLDSLFAPVIYILYPIPKIVLLPVLLVLLGLGGAPKIALITLTIFFQVIVSVRDSSKSISQEAVTSVKSLGANKIQLCRHVYFPATLPSLFSTLRVSSGIAIAVLFFAEAIAGSSGIGYFIMQSWAMIDYSRMFSGVCALAILGVFIYLIFDIAEKYTTKWRSV